VQYFRRVARLAATAAEALEHAHQVGVVHRDVKPANLLLDRRGHLWITDFGLALLQNNAAVTTTGELVGTLRYMSPEQAGAQRGLVDHRTDIYSLGATLYELLTLEPLFAGNDPRELVDRIAHEEPRPPRSVDRAIPKELEVIVLKALAKAPAERYTTAQELADDLRRFLEDQPIRARRPSFLDRATKWARQQRGVAVSALGLLLLAAAALLVTTALVTWAHREARAAYRRERQKAEEAEQQRARAEANFLQARNALDLLTQASADELVDRPEFLEVRRKLLERALQYYQKFIDQHEGDPSTLAQLAVSRARVAQILGALSAQQEYLRRMQTTMLLEEFAVREDLRITPGQDEKFLDLLDRLADQRREAFRGTLTLAEEERGKKFKEMAAANERAVAAALAPRQAARLKQIALQQRVPLAFSEPEETEALHLTEDQKARIRAIQDDAQRALRIAPWHGPADADQRAQQVGRGAAAKILAELTPPQRATWNELTGEPFRGRVHVASLLGSGPDDPGHPGPNPPGPRPAPPGSAGRSRATVPGDPCRRSTGPDLPRNRAGSPATAQGCRGAAIIRAGRADFEGRARRLSRRSASLPVGALGPGRPCSGQSPWCG
jgi:hypothetical protein